MRHKNFLSAKIIIACTFLFTLISTKSFSQNVGINNPTPDASSLLDLTSTDKGLLVPRMTTAQRTGISLPATGLLVYDATLNTFYYFDGTQWKSIFTSSAGWGLPGNTGTNPAINFVGTADNQPLSFRVNNTNSGRIDHINHNTSLGLLSLAGNTTGSSNIAIGDSALFSNTTSGSMTAIG
ncbi:MAG: hypothetical protein ABI723_00650 [Bacteroidia bacterium]